jgi:hypothetical protein
MQPCFGITETRLTNYYTGLRVIGVGAVEEDPSTKALLCLSGLHYAFSYYKAARSGSEFETYYGPAHRPDDGLRDTAFTVLKRLMRGSRSRTITGALAVANQQGPMNEEWLRWQLAWVSSDDMAKGRVQDWLTRTGVKEGWLRLSVATGICSLWASETVGFIHSMMRKPFPSLIPSLDGDRNARVADCLKSFVRDHRVDMGEL